MGGHLPYETTYYTVFYMPLQFLLFLETYFVARVIAGTLYME